MNRKTILCLLLLLGLLAVPAPVAAQQATVHVVQWGENLTGIAAQYGVTVQALMAANGLTRDTIYAGQRLAIPTGATAGTPAYHVVQWGENLSGIAARYGVTVAALMRANGLLSPDFIYAGQRLALPGGERATAAPLPVTYTVQPGDSLSGIAERFGLNTAALARLNGIINPSFIYVGQVLRLQSAAVDATPVTAPGGNGQRIYINLTQQRLYAYQDAELIRAFTISSGMAPYYTQTGDFSVLNKLPNPYSNMWGLWMPHWLGIYWVGGAQNGIHALPIAADGQRLWEGYLGRPASFGCIILGIEDAEWLYHWVEVGTPVIIRY